LVIEHIFVTTCTPHDIVGRVGNLMNAHGFAAAPQVAFSVDPNQPMQLEYRKKGGRRSFRLRQPSLSECEQTVRLDFDRGRVTLAAALTHHASANVTIGTPGKRAKKILTFQENILFGLAHGVEGVLSQPPAPDAAARWDAAIAAADTHARRASNRTLLIFLIVVALLGALVTTAVMSSK
jgi:hypothetical protein